MKSRLGRKSTALAVAALVATAIAGGSLTAIAAARGTAKAAVHKVIVTETDNQIALAPDTVVKGNTTFVVHNAGAVAHKFAIKGNGVSRHVLGLIKPGKTKSLVVPLKKLGAYQILCGLHAASGMTATLTVVAPSPTTTTTTTNPTTTGGGGWG